MRDMEASMLPYFGLLKNVLGLVDTEHYTYGELFNEIHLRTGGLSFQIASYTDARNLKEFKMMFEVKAKAFYGNTADMFALIKEILFTSRLEDEKRLKEILGEMKSRMQARMINAGHSLAVARAMSYISEAMWAEEQINGVSFYRFVTELLADFDNRKAECFAKMREALDFILRKGRVLYDYTGTEEGLVVYKEAAAGFHNMLNDSDNGGKPFKAELSVKQEGFCTSAGIQYVCRVGNYAGKDLDYTGALKVLKVMMGYDYLWVQIRVKGGAYGCMSNFTKSGYSYFVSYRDPNLKQTLDVYASAPEYLRKFEADEDTMTKYIIGAIAEKDTPLTPSITGSRSYTAYMTGQTYEEEQKERDEILGCTLADIHRMGDYIQAMLDEDVLCVVGNEDKIKENGELFGEIMPLF